MESDMDDMIMESVCSDHDTLEKYFDTSVFTNIAEAQNERKKVELVQDYQEFTGRIELLEDGFLEDEFEPAKEAQIAIQKCSGKSERLDAQNIEEVALLEGISELVDDVLFRLEYIHSRKDSCEKLIDEEGAEYDEEFASKAISALMKDNTNTKNLARRNIMSCGATLSKLKMEISELINKNPKARRQSKAMGMLGKLQLESLGVQFQRSREDSHSGPRSSPPPPEVEEFDPGTMANSSGNVIEDLIAFVKFQELPDEESRGPLRKLSVVAKTIEHFKTELKAANAKATDDQLKLNNLQKRLPKLEESRVRLSQKCDDLQDQLTEKDSQIVKLNAKMKTMDHVQDPAVAQAEAAKKDKQEKKEQTKQAVIPKSVLKDLLKASDTELEEKLSGLASSNEAIKVVLVRKNKQLRKLEGQMLMLDATIASLNAKIKALEENRGASPDSATAGTPLPNPTSPVLLDPRSVAIMQEPSGILPMASEFTANDSIMLGLSDETIESEHVVTVEDTGVGTEYVEVEEIGIQTDLEVEDEMRTPSPSQMGFIKLKKKGRKDSRRGSMFNPSVIANNRRNSSIVSNPRRRSSMANSDMFGMGAANHKLTTNELSAIAEINCIGPPVLDNSQQQKTDADVLVLQKYIASLRDQSEKSMEKVRDFIAKEKTRTEATTRRLINEHEKILNVHKKEINKIVYSVFRFKEMLTEILLGKDITQIALQCAFKFEQSPLQLRIQSTEMLSAMEYEVFQALREKDCQIRDLSGRKRLEDKDLDRRIKAREKTVFSLLDYTNEKLRKEKERVTEREKWVNQKIKTDFEYEKQQDRQILSVENALHRFWIQQGRESQAQLTEDMTSPDQGPRQASRSPSPPFGLFEQNDNKRSHSPTNKSPRRQKSPRYAIPEDLNLDDLIPRLWVSVPDQKNNLKQLGIAHRAGAMSNLGHKMVTNIIERWLDVTSEKISVLFYHYMVFMRYSKLMDDLMKKEEGSEETNVVDIDRAMLLHKRIRSALDQRHKRLHVEIGKLNEYRGDLLDQEEQFFSSLNPNDTRAMKGVIRPTMLHINHNAVLKKILASTKQQKKEITVTFPHISEDSLSTTSGSVKLEDIAQISAIENTTKDVKHWKVNHKPTQDEEVQVKSLLIPRLVQIDTHKCIPVRLEKPSMTIPPIHHLSGLPPVATAGCRIKTERIGYIPNIASVWSNNDSSRSD